MSPENTPIKYGRSSNPHVIIILTDLHALKNEAHKEEADNFERKNACLGKFKEF